MWCGAVSCGVVWWRVVCVWCAGGVRVGVCAWCVRVGACGVRVVRVRAVCVRCACGVRAVCVWCACGVVWCGVVACGGVCGGACGVRGGGFVKRSCSSLTSYFVCWVVLPVSS